MRLFAPLGEVLEVQAASNNTIKGGFTAKDEPTDKEGLVAACTGGLLQASGQANSPALQAGVSISGADAAANFTGTPQGQSPTSGTNRIHEGPPREIKPRGLGAPGVVASGAQMLRLYQPEVDEFQVGASRDTVLWPARPAGKHMHWRAIPLVSMAMHGMPPQQPATCVGSSMQSGC